MILPFEDKAPRIAADVYVAPNATVIGDVEIGSRSSVWFGTVVRGDVHRIRIGERTNVQDNSVLHVTNGTHPLTIGSEVTIGHGAIVHGCTLGDRILVGMGAIILDGALIGDGSIVGAGALVPEGAEYPPRSLIMGIPGKSKRQVTDAELERIIVGNGHYLTLCESYLKGAAEG